MQLNHTRLVTRLSLLVPAIALALSVMPTSASSTAPAATELSASAASANAAVTNSAVAALDAAAWTDVEIGAVDPKVFALALHAASTAMARGEARDLSTLTVIDFSRPSTERRMWVYDLRTKSLLFEELVSHGRGSGANLATSFSNLPESNKSSIGLYRTAEPYIGKHGYSLKLDGLDRGFNDKARERAIVIHAADYVNGTTAKAQGRLGRSLGCPAVRPEIAHSLIDAVKGGGLVFAYYPDPTWLATSAYLS
jgi:hypothetical protein